MKRILLVVCFIFAFCFSNSVFALDAMDIHKPIVLQEGTFLRASMQREVSTATNRVGDEVRMIATTPTFASDAVIIPENSIYYGKIIEINQPIEGVNGSLRIKIDKVVFPNGEDLQLDAMLWHRNHNLFGGELAQPAYYLKVPHYTHGWKGGCLAFQNSGIYNVGVPTIIKAGAELLIILQKDTTFQPYEL